MREAIARNSSSQGLRVLAVALAASAAGGCGLPGRTSPDVSGLPVDATSPVAQDVLAASRNPGPYPKFSDIPKAPTDVRPPEAYAAAVAEVKAERQGLGAQASAMPPPPTDTEAFAAGRRESVRGAGEPAPESAPADTDAYARSLRERATPPPPPK